MISRKYLIIPLGFLSALLMGTVYSWSVFRVPLENSLGISSSKSGLPFLVFLALYAFTMPVAGELIERFKPSLIAITGSLLLSAGYLLSGYCSTIHQLVIGYGVLGGIGVGMLYGVPVAMASRWFPGSKGIATGGILLGFGLSPLVTAPVASTFIENYGVSDAFVLIGIGFLLLLPVMALFFTNPEDYSKQKPSVAVYGDNLPVTRYSSFYLLWLLFFIVTFSGLMAISISSPFSQSFLNISSTDAAMILSLLALFNGMGRLLFGFMLDKAGFRITLIISYLLLIFSSLTIATLSPGQSMKFVISMAILWGVFGGWLTIAPVSVIKLFGELNSAKNYGKLFTAYGFGAITGVTLASKVKEITGKYDIIFYVVFFMAILGIFIISKMPLQKNKVIPVTEFTGK
ncbi:MAG: OFA family MFS transporter [Bacteroidales bacterium]|nr:OFA family MFS transporter [Bacteroidales bacterium]